MASIIRIKRGKGTFYYLEHSIRDGSKVYKKRKYLGKSVPKNIAVLKEQLIDEFYGDRWYPQFEKIKACYKSILHKTPKSVQEKNTEAFMVRFTYDTQRIEGSKLSFRDTGKALIDKIVPKNARIDDIKEAEGHKKIFYLMFDFDGDLTLETILDWHKTLFYDTKPDIAGKVRDYPVLISNSDFFPPKPEHLEYMLSDFFDWYNRSKESMHPVRLAALAHLKFVTIHPFGDGNGRISRIILNFVLKKFRYPMIDIKYTNRYGYYKALERSQIAKDERLFSEWFFRRYIEENKNYLNC
jgi:Fic family protein